MMHSASQSSLDRLMFPSPPASMRRSRRQPGDTCTWIDRCGNGGRWTTCALTVACVDAAHTVSAVGRISSFASVVEVGEETKGVEGDLTAGMEAIDVYTDDGDSVAGGGDVGQWLSSGRTLIASYVRQAGVSL